MAYRDDVGEVARDLRWIFFRFLPLFLGVVVTLAVMGFGLRSMGVIGSTVVEREVFERSYQRSEALNARIATDEAALEEINHRLRIPGMEASTRAILEAQASAARIRISTARSQQR